MAVGRSRRHYTFRRHVRTKGTRTGGINMILVIDNYDSFTYNLVQVMGEMGAELHVERNDQVTLDEVRAMQPTHIVISPGTGTPDDSGVSLDVLRFMGET